MEAPTGSCDNEDRPAQERTRVPKKATAQAGEGSSPPRRRCAVGSPRTSPRPRVASALGKDPRLSSPLLPSPIFPLPPIPSSRPSWPSPSLSYLTQQQRSAACPPSSAAWEEGSLHSSAGDREKPPPPFPSPPPQSPASPPPYLGQQLAIARRPRLPGLLLSTAGAFIVTVLSHHNGGVGEDSKRGRSKEASEVITCPAARPTLFESPEARERSLPGGFAGGRRGGGSRGTALCKGQGEAGTPAVPSGLELVHSHAERSEFRGSCCRVNSRMAEALACHLKHFLWPSSQC